MRAFKQNKLKKCVYVILSEIMRLSVMAAIFYSPSQRRNIVIRDQILMA